MHLTAIYLTLLKTCGLYLNFLEKTSHQVSKKFGTQLTKSKKLSQEKPNDVMKQSKGERRVGERKTESKKEEKKEKRDVKNIKR